MIDVFEINGDDIAKLDDAELRILIGLLCEADYRLAGLSTTGITWGGNQDARDGGLDVVVRGEAPPQTSFVPRAITGFQVKKPDMPRRAILAEMKPGGILREEIKNLILENGAYIIVSSTGSTTATALRSRVDAMKEAIADELNRENLHLDFLDRGRVATWVRNHPSLILWVRNKVGRNIKGWHPYGNWSNSPGGVDDEYLIDDGLRLHNGKNQTDNLSIIEGLRVLRDVISTPRSSTRLAGLSGVGKTRLVQALFDKRIGGEPLDPTQAFYTDMSYGPEPDPVTFVEQIIARRSRAIVLIDNCPPDLHRLATQAVSAPGSSVSLLTVEYDVRDDIPEETNVFTLEPSSKEIIQKLIQRRFPHISKVDGESIAEFSGGNARVAIALANTVERNETLSGFNDDQLFTRLFQQRKDPSESLLRSAEACSLVYSFEGTDITSDRSELDVLAKLSGKTGKDLYRDVSELKERELVQSRNVWRAVLPHAIANRLAKRALQSIPKDDVVQTFLYCGSERLLKSFTKRLSFLHDLDVAVEIVDNWLEVEGWLGKAIIDFNSLGIDAFKNVASVSPEKALAAIERAANSEHATTFISRNNHHFHEFVKLLRHFAYDPKLFERSFVIIARFALSERKDENYNSIRNLLKSLFYPYLSGTHAPPELRAKMIEELVLSPQQDRQDLGLELLAAALETWHFASFHDFGFGARPRDYGYFPKTRYERKYWYEIFTGISVRLALSAAPISDNARKLLSDHLRGLWSNAGIYDALETAVSKIHAQHPWPDAWIAVRSTMRYDSEVMGKEALTRLQRLEESIRPVDLLQRARTFAISGEHHTFDLEENLETPKDPTSGWRKVEETTRRIGAQVAQDTDILDALLPELLTAQNRRIVIFGNGLGDGCDDKRKLWEILRRHCDRIPRDKLRLGVMFGFLSTCAKTDNDFFNETLDAILNDALLGVDFPAFQTVSSIDNKGVNRLHSALDNGIAHINTFFNLAWGGSHESIGDDDLAELVSKIASKDGGLKVAVEILKMRFHWDEKDKRHISTHLSFVSGQVLSAWLLSTDRQKGRGNLDYDLTVISKVIIGGDDASKAADEISTAIVQAIVENTIYPSDVPGLLGVIAARQPIIFLNSFFNPEALKHYQLKRVFCDDFRRSDNPISLIPDDIIISWCDADPQTRYLLIAGTIEPFCKLEETKELAWRPFVFKLLDKAPNIKPVLDRIIKAMRPMSWSGSLADKLQKRSLLLQVLFEHPNEEVSAWSKTNYQLMLDWISEERKSEERERTRRNESFE